MAVEFAQSQTKENLMRAFAGESQAKIGRASCRERV